LEKLIAIGVQNSLVMNYVKDEQNNILCADMMIVDMDFKQLFGLSGATARFSQIDQKDRKKVGRANKFSQWKKILSAKKRGLDWFNFGGEVKEKGIQGINEFKKGFGTITGVDRRIYIPKSILGKVCVTMIYLSGKRFIQKAKK
jgi:hypothetical protein